MVVLAPWHRSSRTRLAVVAEVREVNRAPFSEQTGDATGERCGDSRDQDRPSSSASCVSASASALADSRMTSPPAAQGVAAHADPWVHQLAEPQAIPRGRNVEYGVICVRPVPSRWILYRAYRPFCSSRRTIQRPSGE